MWLLIVLPKHLVGLVDGNLDMVFSVARVGHVVSRLLEGLLEGRHLDELRI
jgi:hypothetical protein